MAFDDIQRGIQKTKRAIPNLHAFKRATTIGVILPTGDALDKLWPTFLYISVVALLEDALESFVVANYPGVELSNFRRKIIFLHSRGRLKDYTLLCSMLDTRNEYAHKYRQYATWNDVDMFIKNVEIELRRLGIL